MITAKHKRIIQQLSILAQDQKGVKRARVVACMTHKNKIIAYGFNSNKTHPFQLDYGTQTRHNYLTQSVSEYKDLAVKFSLNLHAETNCIINAMKRIKPEKLKDCELYVCRIKKSEKGNYVYGLAKPCGDMTKGCTKAILEYRIKNVFYSTDQGTVESLF